MIRQVMMIHYKIIQCLRILTKSINKMVKCILIFFLLLCNSVFSEKQDIPVVVNEIEHKNVPKLSDLKNPIAQNFFLKTSQFETIPRSSFEAVIDSFADKIIKNVRYLMIKNNLDPLAMPDIHEDFNYTVILTHHGEMNLTKGQFRDLSTIHRNGDVTMMYSASSKYLLTTIPLTFDELLFQYNLTAKFLGLKPEGFVLGQVHDVAVEAKIGFDADILLMSLDEFVITNAGNMNLDLDGNFSWILNPLVDIATVIMKKNIMITVEDLIRGGIQSFIDAINEVIRQIIHTSTTP